MGAFDFLKRLGYQNELCICFTLANVYDGNSRFIEGSADIGRICT